MSKKIDFTSKANVLELAKQEKEEGVFAEIQNIPLSFLKPNPDQPRKYFHEDEIISLSSSIKKHGVLQPIIVKKIADEEYYIIAGERRYRACEYLKRQDIPGVLSKADNSDLAILALVENIEREDLSIVEEAEAYKQLQVRFNYTQQQLSEVVNKSRSHVANILRLLNMSQEVRELLNRHKKFTMGHARAILSLSEEQQSTAAEKIINHDLTVRETEDLVRKLQKPEKSAISKNINQELQCYYNDEINLLNSYDNELKLVFDKQSPEQGKITISFDSVEELELVLKFIRSQN